MTYDGMHSDHEAITGKPDSDPPSRCIKLQAEDATEFLRTLSDEQAYLMNVFPDSRLAKTFPDLATQRRRKSAPFL